MMPRARRGSADDPAHADDECAGAGWIGSAPECPGDVASPLMSQSAAEPAAASRLLTERLLDVRDQVVRILDADGKADKRFGDAEAQACFGRYVGVSHCGGVGG